MGMGRKGNHFTLHGQLHEPLALKEYKKATGCRVEQYGLIVSKEKPWLACSPDGVTHCGRLVEVSHHLFCLYGGFNLTHRS